MRRDALEIYLHAIWVDKRFNGAVSKRYALRTIGGRETVSELFQTIGEAEMAMPRQQQEHKAMSWKPEVQADHTGTWAGNALAFGTEQEALDWARDLAGRWYAVRHYRAVISDEPVNRVRDPDGRTRPLVPDLELA